MNHPASHPSIKGIIKEIDIEFIIIPIKFERRSLFWRKRIVMFLANFGNYLTILKTFKGDFV